MNLETFANKILLITGGTGSFGTAALKRFLPTGIKEIRIFSRDEKKQDDMRHQFKDERIKYYIGDVRNIDSLRDAVAGVDFLFQAAALKQVPSCEFYPMEAIRTNSIGTDNVLKAALEHSVAKVVVLSTDKAAYPINAMGMSKALSEKIMVSRSRVAAQKGLVFCGTRYGNVMGSRGSVIPLFVQQIQEGRPLTVTDPNMTRFMMTLENAVELVLFAFENGQPGDLFVQKAPAATLATLVESLKSILKAENPTNVIGVRHGEKLYETLLTREEMARVQELPYYYRVLADTRDLNYNLYFSEGMPEANHLADYNSHNTQRLDSAGLSALLVQLDDVQHAAKTRGIHLPVLKPGALS
jgi:UDP-N-acetylglucosamine 4,6-dehydratase